MSDQETAEVIPGVYARTQARRRKVIEKRRKARGGVGRTDGPRQRKGVRNTAGKRLRAKHVARLDKAEQKRTHRVVFGVTRETGQPTLAVVAK